jgi:hypothetical protein
MRAPLSSKICFSKKLIFNVDLNTCHWYEVEGDKMNVLKYWILRLRDALFPPRTLPDLWDWRLGRDKYSYLSQKRNDDIQKAWRRLRKTRY